MNPDDDTLITERRACFCQLPRDSNPNPRKMVKPISNFFLFALFLGLSVSQATSSVHPAKPLLLKDLKIKSKQSAASARSCSYTVTIRTSCSSAAYNRDQVSLDFGDSHGNEVYAPKLDDPSSRIFERCSTDTFQIRGPCTYAICYLYLRRLGYEHDGWMPESVRVYSPDGRTYTFNFNTHLPNGVWFGFDHCNALLSKSSFVVAI